MTTHFFSDTAALTGRSLRHIARSPDTIITTAITPIALLLIFVYVFGGAIDTGPDSGSYIDYMLPGILLITIVSGIAYTAFRLFVDTQSGIFERFQTMPIARSSILWAHVLTSLVANLASLVVVVGVALLIGFRSGAGVLQWLAVAGILTLFTLALTWIAVIPGLTATSVDGASAFSFPLIFLPFLSSAFVPTSTMPGPVRWFAEHQPVTSIVNTIRGMFAQQPASGDIWTAVRRHPRRRVRLRDDHLSPSDRMRVDAMLTISQLAAHTGVTVAAVRHYHRIGLLPEPRRDQSGYRRYDAAAVVRLIRIHVLASAGVPLARVQGLLAADPAQFADGVRETERHLRAEIRRLQDARKRLARLAAGDQLALPECVVGFLDRLRALGVTDRYLELEGNAWILVAAQVPHLIDAIIEKKHEELDEYPDVVRLYRLLGSALDWPAEDPRVVEIADILERLRFRAVQDGRIDTVEFDNDIVGLLDATLVDAAPVAPRLMEILEERGWKGWTRIERVPANGPDNPTDP